MDSTISRSDALLRAFRGTVVVVLLVTAGAFVAPLGPAATRAVSDGASAICGLLLLAGFAWARHRSRGPDRLAWSVLLFSMLTVLVMYAIDPIDVERAYFPLAFRVGPVVTLLHTLAVLVLARDLIRSIGLARLTVDAVWLAVGVLLIMGNGGRIRLPAALAESTRISLTAQQFNAAGLAAVLGLLLFACRRVDRLALVRLAGPAVAIAASQSVFGFVYVNGDLAHGSAADYVFILAFGFSAVAATHAAGRPGPKPRTLLPGAGQMVVTWGPLVVWGAVSLISHVSVREHDGLVELLVLLVGGVRLSYLASENTKLARRLHTRASQDPLTGLPNRRAIELLMADLGRGPAALLLVDLDRFKAVNDTLGHSAGDDLLRIVGRRMANAVGSDWTVARLAGDEFVVVSSATGDARVAEAMANRVVEGLARPIHLDGREAWVGASVGVAVTGEDLEPTELLDVADFALRAAKQVSKGEVLVADADLRGRARDQGDLETALRRAIDEGELRTLYQPKVDLTTGAMVGVEALVRWDRPGVGVLPPSEFIALAEATGLIARIDSWVLSTAVRDLRRWNEIRSRGPRLHLSTNMSAWQLARIDVDAEVRRALAAAGGIDPAQLTVELTETLLVEDPEIVARRLRKLRDAGVGISIDDFGAGFTSVSYLRKFPVTEVKVDRDLVWELTGGPEDDASLAAAVIALSHALELDVVAEGVETPAQAATLRRLGCRLAQGYLFARPLPAESIDELVGQDSPFAIASYPVARQG